MKTLTLTNSPLLALVDDEDYDYLNSFKWYLHTKGYAYCWFDKKCLLMHRLVFERTDLLIVGMCIHHVDNIKLNNTKLNLIQVTNQQNQLARPKKFTSSSGEPNISWVKDKNRYRVIIGRKGKILHLGSYKTLQDAVKVRDAYLHKEKQTVMAAP